MIKGENLRPRYPTQQDSHSYWTEKSKASQASKNLESSAPSKMLMEQKMLTELL